MPTQKQHSLADHEITEALRNRLLAPCKSPTQPCNYCGALPAIGHEDLCKGASRHWIKRHNEITRAFQKALASRADLEVEIEPVIGPTSPTAATTALRADFSATIGASRYYYDIQVVAVNKASGREEALATLEEAAQEKRRKYSSLGPLFQPLIFSAGGLMEKSTAQAYKGLQALIGPIAAHFLSTSIALTLIKARVNSAASIAKR